MSTTSFAKTRTGGFPIGFRRMWFEWHKDLKALLAWSRENHLGTIDLGMDADQFAPMVTAAGLQLGSVDLPEWKKMISPDKAEREAAIEKNSAYIKTCSAAGARNYFLVMLPEKPELKRSENFAFMVESFQKLAPVLEANQSRIVIEGWPGPGALCCTPEGYGEFFKACPSKAMGVNYDPSHLIRMGVDPIRFLREFKSRVFHVHGKDTELLDEGLYLYGNTQEPTLAQGHGWGGMCWRYTIPGHGVARWTEIFRILTDAGYKGAVSIELEDENFCGKPDGEKAGILHGRDFLQGC